MAQDYSAAMKWYRMAADQGIAQAQCNLGFMYKKAMAWLRIIHGGEVVSNGCRPRRGTSADLSETCATKAMASRIILRR